LIIQLMNYSSFILCFLG